MATLALSDLKSLQRAGLQVEKQLVSRREEPQRCHFDLENGQNITVPRGFRDV